MTDSSAKFQGESQSNAQFYSRRALLVGSALGVLGLAGCASLPSRSDPRVLQTFQPGVSPTPTISPIPGSEPDELIYDFYRALAVPTRNHEAARSFLAGAIADSWHPEYPALVLDSIRHTTQPGATEESRAFEITGNVVGELNNNGAYNPDPDHNAYEGTVTMAKENGEWRITNVPTKLIYESNEIRNNYSARLVFFWDPSQEVLVGDRRWMHNDNTQAGDRLLELLAGGPSEWLSPAVRDVPDELRFVGLTEGIFTFVGASGLTEEERKKLAAQTTWTLESAGLQPPFSIHADGEPLIPGKLEFSGDDFAEYDPKRLMPQESTMYALTEDQHLYELSTSGLSQLPGGLGAGGNVKSAAFTTSAKVAIVQDLGNQAALVVSQAGQLVELSRAANLTEPTFERGGRAFWTVADGTSVMRVVRSEQSEEFSTFPVINSGLEDSGEKISQLRLSPDGARVAMIIDGRLYMGVVVATPGEPRRIVNVRELSRSRIETLYSLAWTADGSLIVGTEDAQSPVWRVDQDGFRISETPSQGLSGPVLSVTASVSTYYATSEYDTRQLPADDSDSTTAWREVSALGGQRAVIYLPSPS